MQTGSGEILMVAIPLATALLAAAAVLQLKTRAESSRRRIGQYGQLIAHALLGLGVWVTACTDLLLTPRDSPPMQDLLLNGLSLGLCLLSPMLCLPGRAHAGRERLYLRACGLGLGISLSLLLALLAAGQSLQPADLPVGLAINLLAAFAICHALLTPGLAGRPGGGRLVTLALGIAVLHFGSLAMISAPPLPATLSLRAVLGSQWLDALAALAVLALLTGVLCSVWLESRRRHQTRHLVHSLTAANRELSKLAYHDPLTHLPNRSLIEEQLRLAMARAQRESLPLAILFIDLDGLKAINKAFGHPQGDQLLSHIATQIQAVLPAGCPVARFGGDEFIVLLNLASTREIVLLGDRILGAVRTPIQIDAHPVSINASLGIARHPQDGDTPRRLLEHANLAMYHAKSSGQPCAFFEPAMNSLAREQILLLSDLRQAIAREQLVLHYQPITHAVDGRLAGAEVLIRWQHPEHGLLRPEAFIDHAEQAGLIIEIGAWVIDSACRQLRAWTEQGAGTLRLAINISAIQLRHDTLADTLEQLVQRHGVEPARLTLEFTESAAMTDPAHSLAVLERLQQLGFHISLDDFGTGYSSLLYLKQLPADELKIDRSFVSGLASNRLDHTIVSTIITLARQLGMSTVAEGVETPAQQQMLRELGCTYLQGYLLGPPVPAEQLLASVPA